MLNVFSPISPMQSQHALQNSPKFVKFLIKLARAWLHIFIFLLMLILIVPCIFYAITMFISLGPALIAPH